MRIALPPSGAIVLPVLLLASCQSTAQLEAGDRAAIAAASAAWKRAVLAGDTAALATVYTEDAILLPPNMAAISGRAGVMGFFGQMPKILGIELEHVEVDGRGDLAFERGSYRMTLQVPGVPSPVEDRGKFIEIWRRSSSGSWQIARDMFSSDLPVPK